MSYTIPDEAYQGINHPDYDALQGSRFANLDFNAMALSMADTKSVGKFAIMAPRHAALAYLLGVGVNFDLSQHVAGAGFVGADHYDHAYQG